MIKKSVGGRIVTVTADTELITWQKCGYTEDVNIIVVTHFYVKNEDEKDIYVRINGGSEGLLRPQESFVFDSQTDIVSCVVATGAKIRWGGLR